MREEMDERTLIPGVALGLSWTAAGGETLYIEATQMFGKKGLNLTGQLGDVMKESAQTALSWVRAHARQLGIEDSFFERVDLHLHVPEGAIPKDGPSAGRAQASTPAPTASNSRTGRTSPRNHSSIRSWSLARRSRVTSVPSASSQSKATRHSAASGRVSEGR